ncbi:MAG: hypothetical protein R3Y12_09030 [Clostridia bacterium]
MRVLRFDAWLCLAISYGVAFLPSLFVENYSQSMHLIVLTIIFIVLRRVGSQLGLFSSIFYTKSGDKPNFAERMLRKFSYDYCNDCKKDMTERTKKLYFVPLNASTEFEIGMKFDYFEQNAVPINDLSEIPTGFHGGYAKMYQCGDCGKQTEAFEVFLPVRGQEIAKLSIQVLDGRLQNLKTFEDN